MPITFADLLRAEGIDPTTVHLVRHQDRRWGRRTPYWLWRTNMTEFERYQRLQTRAVFKVGNLIASFVAPLNNETLFVGLYRVTDDSDTAPPGTIDPISQDDVSGIHFYGMERDERLAEYSGRLVIGWGEGYRSWVQRAHKSTKPMLELRRHEGDADFPGYLRLVTSLSEVETLPVSWIARLREAKGIYVLTCPKTKELYVGSATGDGGFFDRWCQHATKGGDAVKFRSKEPSDYQVSILEVAGSNAAERDILHAEYLWMRKLQTVEMGLNGGVLKSSISAGSLPQSV